MEAHDRLAASGLGWEELSSEQRKTCDTMAKMVKPTILRPIGRTGLLVSKDGLVTGQDFRGDTIVSLPGEPLETEAFFTAVQETSLQRSGDAMRVEFEDLDR